MNKWSNSLCRVSISKHLIDEVKKEYEGDFFLSLLNSMSKDIKNRNDFKELGKNVNQLKGYISEESFRMILEEQTEIKNDLKWIGSKRGKYILEINDWVQSFYSEFRSNKEFEDVLIGGHSERMVVFLTGKIEGKDTFEKLLNFIESKKPPHKLLFQIEINKK